LLSSAEAAARLGVKRQTLYAYVSRGLLASVPLPGGRGSGFEAAAVDALLRRSRAGRRAANELTVATAVTSTEGGRLRYRGRDAVALAGRDPFEAVATWLWDGRLDAIPCLAPPEVLDVARAVSAPLAPDTRTVDRLRVIAAAAATADPLRFDLSPSSVMAAGRTLLGVMVDCLPQPRDRPGVASSASVAERLWPRLSPLAPAPEAVAALDAALVLMADHELATSTFAARVAASTRANPYAVVGAGLGALDGPLHGTVSELVHRLLVDAERDGTAAAVSSRQRHGTPVPGFGHAIYTGGDPRAPALLDVLDAAPLERERLALAHDVLDAVMARTGVAPNCDYALGAFAFAARMRSDGGEAVFAIARIAGWIAHALEEYGEAPLRFRIRAHSVETAFDDADSIDRPVKATGSVDS
jgi:citrate synthase